MEVIKNLIIAFIFFAREIKERIYLGEYDLICIKNH